MKRLSIICILSLACFTIFPTFSSQCHAAEQTVTTLKVTSFMPIGTPPSDLLEQWGKELEKRTNGRVKVNFYGGSTLAPPVQQYDAVQKGIADVGNHVIGYTAGRFPLLEVFELPMPVVNWTIASKMTNEFYKKFRPKELEGVKVLWMHCAGGFVFTKKKPVNKIEDLKGLKMRTFGANTRFMSLLGGIPVAMPTTEIYDALSRGVVDGLMGNYESLQSFKIGDLLKYGIENRESAWLACWVAVMNKDKFNALPEDIRILIDRMSEEQVEKWGRMWDSMDKNGREYLIKKGVKIIVLPREEDARWAARAKPLYDDYIKRMKEQNLPGEEAAKFVQDYMKQHKNDASR